MKKEIIASIFARATSQTNCSTVLPSSPICSIFHGIKRLCLERQNTLTINHAEFEPPQGGRHIIRELVSVHVHCAWMLINWNSPKVCGRRTRNRSTTWSGLMHSKIFMNIIILWVQFLLYRYIVHDVLVYLLHVWFLGFPDRSPIWSVPTLTDGQLNVGGSLGVCPSTGDPVPTVGAQVRKKHCCWSSKLLPSVYEFYM